MQKRPGRIVGIVIYGIFTALWNFIPTIGDMRNSFFLFIGLICIFLSFGLLMLWNWVRIMAFVFSFLFISMYIFLIILAIMGAYQGFAGVAAFFHFPTLILSLLYIDNLRRKEIKAYFK